MAIQKPTIPKGTRDFSPEEMVKRNFIFDTIRSQFQRFGFLPIETPAMENLTTLMGKYGEEGDKLIFKILNSGNYFSDFKDDTELIKTKEKGENFFTKFISEKALKYDLTVPFARYVVQHQNEITFPFKRYQIQPVWRADRPQKGRYREFYQCDADVIGSNALLNEVELVQLMDAVYTALNIPVVILINNRKILSGIADVIGEKERIVLFTVALDKLDKIGADGVNKELLAAGFSELAVAKVQPLITFKGDTLDKLNFLKEFLKGSEIGLRGIEEVEYVFETLKNLKLKTATCELDVTLARGLNYYTGAIFEVKSIAGSLRSSICGGGRYDDLTGIFGLPNMSGVGISFGADRIYDVMDELKLFPEKVAASTKLLFANFGQAEQSYCLPLLNDLRNAGVNCEIYPEAAKMKKQMSYADAKRTMFVVLAGADEMLRNEVTVKNMQTGDQITINKENLVEFATSH
jgi:histidyl-tRNA synthetase